MTKYEKYLDAVCESEILYMTTNNRELPAQSLRVGGDYGIFINESHYETTAERLVATAHEIAHCKTGALYSLDTPLFERERYEHRAWKSTIHDLLPFDELKAAMIDCTYHDGLDIYELADKKDVTVEFVTRAIEHYCNRGYRW